jgi:hypothetical protein
MVFNLGREPPRHAERKKGTGQQEQGEGQAGGAGGTRGVSVACGNLDGVGPDEIITASYGDSSYTGHTMTVTCWKWVQSGQPLSPWRTFSAGLAHAFWRNPRTWGLNLACGDVDGDGLDEVIVAEGMGSQNGWIEAWTNFTGSFSDPNNPANTATIPDLGLFNALFSGISNSSSGLRVAAGDFDGDGYDDVCAVEGPGRIAQIYPLIFGLAPSRTPWNFYLPRDAANFWNRTGSFAWGVNPNVAFPLPGSPTVGFHIAIGNVVGQSWEDVIVCSDVGPVGNAFEIFSFVSPTASPPFNSVQAIPGIFPAGSGNTVAVGDIRWGNR